jgi:synaptobrevin family protein YKT6
MEENITALFHQYKEPAKVDRITQIQKDLEETKDIVTRNIQQMLNRGEKLEDLLERSEHLSQDSKQFVIRAKKLNRCCTIV